MNTPRLNTMPLDQGIALRICKQYLWTPQPDITAYELALMLPYCLGYSAYMLEDYLTLHPQFARHWTEQK